MIRRRQLVLIMEIFYNINNRCNLYNTDKLNNQLIIIHIKILHAHKRIKERKAHTFEELLVIKASIKLNKEIIVMINMIVLIKQNKKL